MPGLVGSEELGPLTTPAAAVTTTARACWGGWVVAGSNLENIVILWLLLAQLSLPLLPLPPLASSWLLSHSHLAMDVHWMDLTPAALS